MYRIILLLTMASGSISLTTRAESPTALHRTASGDHSELSELFRWDGSAMPLMSAHRGGGVMPGFPENCIETFEHTLTHGFSILEIDLRVTKDGEIILLHDENLDRTTTGSGPVAELMLQEVKQLKLRDKDGNVTEFRVPTLDEVLRWARGKTIVILDKKKVSVEDCVKKIQEHDARDYAMLMAYSFDDIKACHALDPNILMEVMIGNERRLQGFEASGVPPNRVIAFVGHDPPQNRSLIKKLHERGICCMAGTSRNLDRELRQADEREKDQLKTQYRSRLQFGIDILETDMPVQVADLLYAPPVIPDSKAHFFKLPETVSNKTGLRKIGLSDDKRHFVVKETGETFRPWGFNFVGDFGRIVEEYWIDDWESVKKDFRQMRDLGGNVVRLHLQLGTYMKSVDEVDAKQLRQLSKTLDLASQTGLYLDLTGLGCYHIDNVPDWFDGLDEKDRWQTQANFWEAIAKTCSGHPAVFCYDLMNEPVLGEPKEGEHPWLLGELGGQYFVQRICNDPKDRSRPEIVRAWVHKMVSAIRKQDKETLVTVGVIPWAHVWPNAKPLFYAPEIAEHFDFVSVHFYPQKREVEKALKALAVYDIGKPLVVEETFPMKCTMQEFEEFINRGNDVADGWIAHYFGRTIEEHRGGAEPAGPIVAKFLEFWRDQ